jgi:hypothetical protein
LIGFAIRARAEGRLKSGPSDAGYPVGYWAYIADPDGNNLEVSYGQEIGITVTDSREVLPLKIFLINAPNGLS